MNERNCRLCLKTIYDDSQIIEESVKDTLNQLLHLNLHVSKEAVMCNQCANIIQVLFNFKSALVIKGGIFFTNFANDVSVNPTEVKDTSNVKSLVDSINHVKCRFCRQNIGREDLISLNESKESLSLMNMLKQHIPELGTNNSEEFLTCPICLDFLQNLLNFITNWLDVEHKINKYVEIEGTDDNNHIELRDVQQFTSKGALNHELEYSDIDKIGKTYDNSEANYNAKPDAATGNLGSNIKTEVIDIKTEFVDIKSEQSDYDSNQELSTDDMDHTHEQPLAVKKYKCEICIFETKHKSSLASHMVIHKSPSELTMYKCDKCKFETKHKSCLTMHKVMHRNPSDITVYKCEMCSYVARFRKHLVRHMWIHGRTSNIKMNKCEICAFETRHKSDLNRHVLCHKNPWEVPLYKCELCTYETIQKKNFTKHMLTHKVRPYATAYKCYTCSFEIKDKSNLRRHMLTHRDPSEITMHRCVSCGFETKQKRYLTKHMLIHSEVTTFKCELCTHETKHKNNLARHMLIHKSPSDVTMFKCKICTFETKQKINLSKHMLIHKKDLVV